MALRSLEEFLESPVRQCMMCHKDWTVDFRKTSMSILCMECRKKAYTWANSVKKDTAK